MKCIVKDDLQHIRNWIELKQADVVAREVYIKDKVVVLSVLSQVIHIIERFYSDDTEENLSEQYNKLGQKILDWYKIINKKLETNNQ